MLRLTTFASLMLAGLVVASAAAADKDQPAPKDDAAFFVEAVSQNQMKVRLSEQAQSKATDPKVKDFAQRMAKEHKDLNDKLAKQAEGLKIAVVAGNEAETKEKLNRLAQLKGAEYDRAYMMEMVSGHEGGQKLYEGYSKTATNTGLKSFITDTGASEKKHLEESRKILEGLGK